MPAATSPLASETTQRPYGLGAERISAIVRPAVTASVVPADSSRRSWSTAVSRA